MRHVDEDTLALLALGEDVADDAALEHLRTCETCMTALTELRAVVGVARAGGGPLLAPPERVWDRIAAEVGGTAPRAADAAGDGGTHLTGEGLTVLPTAERSTGAGPSTPPVGDRGAGERPAGGDELAARRSGRSRVLWAVAGLAAGVAGTLVVQWASPGEPTPEVLAQAELAPLPGWAETGTARVEEVDGRLLLHVEVSGGTPQDAFREVWLLDANAERLVSVGLLPSDEATFELPSDIDLGEFVVVDVSREPVDGDPAHSGDSIVRGQLDT